MELKGQYTKFACAYAKIYTLSDQSGNVFYVGCTVREVHERLTQHIQEAKLNHNYGNRSKNTKIRELDFKVIATIVDMIYVTGTRINVLKSGRAHQLEKKWIDKYLSLGYNLVNRRPFQKIVEKKKSTAFVGQVFISDAGKITERVTEAETEKVGG